MGMKDLSTYREEKAPLSSIQWLNQQKCNEHLLCFRHFSHFKPFYCHKTLMTKVITVPYFISMEIEAQKG